MVATFSAGTPLRTIETTLREHDLFLPPVLPEASCRPSPRIQAGTIGGLYSDPRELDTSVSLGRVRDHVLGIEGVRGDGLGFRSGGRVVKNVTGYDLTRFLCGGRGRWGVATKLHWRLQRIPEEVVSTAFQFAQPDAAFAALDDVRASGIEPLSVTLFADHSTIVIVDGGREGVATQRLDRHREALHRAAGSEVAAPASEEAGESGIRLRIRAPYSAWPEVLRAATGASPESRLRWSIILPWAGFGFADLESGTAARLTQELGALRAQLAAAGATVAVEFITEELRDLPAQLLFGAAEKNPMQAVARRLLAEWDPAGTLSHEASTTSGGSDDES